MAIRTALVLMLVGGTTLVTLPPAAEAGLPKSPLWVTVTADSSSPATSRAARPA
jgi:hypothetical protein